jgi:adenylylsulfate kinase-like enzyme
VSDPGAILLSGPVGSGKTTLLLEIGDVLDDRGERYALVDLDWLAWVHLAPDTTHTVHEVLIENLRAVWGTYRRAGVERLVLARYLTRREQLDSIRHALPDVDIVAVHLAVPAPVSAGATPARHSPSISRSPAPAPRYRHSRT